MTEDKNNKHNSGSHQGRRRPPPTRRSKSGSSGSNGHGNSGHSQNNHSNSHSSTNQGNNNQSKGSSNHFTDFFQSFVKGAAATAGAQFTSGLGSNDDKDKSKHGDPGKFDLFLFAQSWAPKFCCDNESKCKFEKMTDLDGLAVHGIWPAYNGPDSSGRTYPSFCSKDGEKANLPKGRQTHEWAKHGTCTSFKPQEYIEKEQVLADNDTILDIRDVLLSAAGASVPINEIFDVAGGPKKVALQSNNFCQLLEITTCWKKNSDGTIGEQIDCPDHLLGSARNSAIVNGCKHLALDQTGEKCQFITKEFLRSLKEMNK